MTWCRLTIGYRRFEGACVLYLRGSSRSENCIEISVTNFQFSSHSGRNEERLKSGNAWYHSVQNLLSSSFLSKNIKIKIYRTIILLVVLYGCETWSRTLREERRLRVLENMVLRRIFWFKRGEITEEWWKLHNEELWSVLSPIIIRVIKSKWDGRSI
jgi:hypothetical protein